MFDFSWFFLKFKKIDEVLSYMWLRIEIETISIQKVQLCHIYLLKESIYNFVKIGNSYLYIELFACKL